MAPDIDELIKKVNTLTLDKNRLRQKLNQLSHNGNQSANSREAAAAQLVLTNQTNILLGAGTLGTETLEAHSKPESPKKSSPTNTTSSSAAESSRNKNPTSNANVISGVECATSCEEDLLYINELYRNRLEEYGDNWDYLQSKCSALLAELNALQKHYAMLKAEKLDLEERLKVSSDEYDAIKSELQTVVLNYESQLSAMSDHLSMITSQVNMADNLSS